jgi:ArsR family transcriptional regulator
MMPSDAYQAGWTVGESLPLELDQFLSVVAGYFDPLDLPQEIATLVRSLPADWLGEWQAMMGVAPEQVILCELLGTLAGMLHEADYSRATLAMRELTLEQALVRCAKAAARDDIGASAWSDHRTGSPAEQLADLMAGWQKALFTGLGLTPISQAGLLPRIRRNTLQMARVLTGGDLHARFWHWLDRYYYDLYRPWRTAQAGTMRAAEQQARLALGALSRDGQPPDLSWLQPANPLLRYPELNRAVLDGRLAVFFWVEPFGLSDTWALTEHEVIVSFARPGVLYENFRKRAIDVAGRAAALGDPTRLIILRMIRNFGMVNTDIAEYLQLSRPTVSIHAKILREAGLIESHQEGRLVRHEIVPGAVRQLFQDLQRFLDLSDEQ